MDHHNHIGIGTRGKAEWAVVTSKLCYILSKASERLPGMKGGQVVVGPTHGGL